MIKMNNAEFRAYAVYNHVLQYVHKEILEDIFRIIVRVKYNEKKLKCTLRSGRTRARWVGRGRIKRIEANSVLYLVRKLHFSLHFFFIFLVSFILLFIYSHIVQNNMLRSDIKFSCSYVGAALGRTRSHLSERTVERSA